MLRLLDNDNAETLATYRGHRADDFQVECGILSNDSQIVCGSSNGEAFIWDLVDEKVISRLSIGKKERKNTVKMMKVLNICFYS